MADLKSRPVQFLPWETWQDKLGIGAIIFVLIVLFGCLTFGSTIDTPMSRQNAACRLVSWGYWQPDAKGSSATMVAKCALPDGKMIDLREAVGWTPLEIGSEIKIEIVSYRLSGTSYYIK